MKLRNKKTGVIIEPDRVAVIKNTKETSTASFNRITANYYSLADLNEEWEDYKPAKPLIKDEKIRKAVRVWAEANGLDSLPIYYDANYHRFCDDPDFSIAIRFYREVKGELNSGYSYYLDELCGEEEE